MQRVALAAVGERDAGLAAVDAMQGHAAGLEQDGRAIRQARGDQVLDHLVLPIHGNGAATGWPGQVDVVPDPVEQQVDAMVAQALALQALAHAGCHQQVDRPLLQHARPDASFHVLAAAVLDDHGIDTGAAQQMTQQQACRPGADDRDLGAHRGLPPPVSSLPAWPAGWAVAAAPGLWCRALSDAPLHFAIGGSCDTAQAAARNAAALRAEGSPRTPGQRTASGTGGNRPTYPARQTKSR